MIQAGGLTEGNTGMCRTILLRAVVGAVVTSWVAGCATDRLDAAPPSGVSLAGDWQLNTNLSDDPDKLGPDPDMTAPKPGGGHRGRGGGRGGMGMPGGSGMPGGGGMPPMGTPPDDGPTADIRHDEGPNADSDVSHAFVSRPVGDTGSPYQQAGYGFVRVGLEQSNSGPATSTGTATDSGSGAGATPGKPTRGASINRLLRAPLAMSITQENGSLTVKTNMPDGTPTVDVYTAGTKTTIPFGADQTADRTAGWRGPVFVVTTSAKKFGDREDDFAIDADDGRLIMTTLTHGGKLGKVAITRVYDRVRNINH